MKQHVLKVASTCFYQLRRLRQLRNLVGKDVTAQLVSAFILSRLDHCNSLLAGLSRSTILPLQRVQNAAARLVLDLRPHDHVTPALKLLHWLPVESRITYKLCMLMHKIYIGNASQYLADCVVSVASSSINRRPGLRSADTAKYVECTTRTKFGERAFSHAGSTAWNMLPSSLHNITDTTLFKKRLKTHLFQHSFSDT